MREPALHAEKLTRTAMDGNVTPRPPPSVRAFAPAFLEEERAAMGHAWFAQESLCEFIDDGGAWFTRAIVEAALCDGDPLRL